MATIRNENGYNCLLGDRPPPFLGKFLDADGVLASLVNETLKFTPPEQLNDEWDCVPSGYKSEDIEASWHNHPQSCDDPELTTCYVEGYNKRDWRLFRKGLSSAIGVASFADVSCCDKEWMWNRYGDQHRGGLILYDTSTMGEFIKVQYLDSRPCVSLPLKNQPCPPEDVIAVLQTKMRNTKDHWEKECEWRKIDHLWALNEVNTSKGIFYLKSYPNAFKMIECGRKMDVALFNKITERAHNKGIQVKREE